MPADLFHHGLHRLLDGDLGRDLEDTIELVAADPVVADAAIAVVGADFDRDVDFVECGPNSHRQLADPEVAIDEVEDLAVDDLVIRPDQRDVGARRIVHLRQRPPHFPAEVE